MTADVATEPLVKEIRIEASPETVFGFFTDPEKLTRWMCLDATVDPRPGGICVQTHQGKDGQRYVMRGEFVEVVPPERFVMTWGWEDDSIGVPPGSSTLEVSFTPDGDATNVLLVHRGLPVDDRSNHDAGWDLHLGRLKDAVSA